MSDTLQQVGEDLVALAIQNAEELGIEVTEDLQAASQYASTVAAELAAAVGTDGFDRALVAARDSVVLNVTSSAITRADAVDQRFLTFVQGLIGLASRALATLVAPNPGG